MRMHFSGDMWEQFRERFVSLHRLGNGFLFPKPQNAFPKWEEREKDTFPPFPTSIQVQLQISFLMKVSVQLRKFAKSNSKSKVYFRVRDGRKDLKSASDLWILEDHFDPATSGYKHSVSTDEVPTTVQQTFNNKVKSIITKLYDTYTDNSDLVWLATIIQEVETSFLPVKEPAEEAKPISKSEEKNTEAAKRGEKSAVELFQIYLDTSHFNEWHLQAQTAIMRKVKRFEGWIRFVTKNQNFTLYLPYFDKAGAEEYLNYIEHEHEYRDMYPEYFNTIKLFKPSDIAPMSQNTLNASMKRLFMFLNWAFRNGYLKHQDYNNVTLCQQVYGDPYYLTIEERDKIFSYDFSFDPRLEFHRDKFMFQCLVGCRANDLEVLTWNHIVDGDFLEYIPHKNLLHGKTQVVRCPLCDKAKELLDRIDPEAPLLYGRYCCDLYRRDIKRILKEVGITRLVTVLDPKTRKAVQVPIYEVAASHLARRTFIGNLYKQVHDPALISSLTGHSERSTAFQRYRHIDDDIKREVLKYIQ